MGDSTQAQVSTLAAAGQSMRRWRRWVSLSCLLWALAVLPVTGLAASVVNNVDTDEQQVFDDQIQQASDLIRRGQDEAATKLLLPLKKQARKSGDRSRQSTVLGLLSDCHLIRGDSEQALRLAKDALNLAHRADASLLIANAHMYLGNAYLALQRHQDAERHFQQALQLAKAGDNDELAVQLSINLIHLARRRGEPEAAVSAARDAFRLILHLDEPHQLYELLTVAWLSEAIVRDYQGQRETYAVLEKPIYHALVAAQRIAHQQHDATARSLSLGYLAELYALKQRPDDAESLLQRALFVAMENNLDDLAARWYRQLGLQLAARGREDDAIVAYTDALHALKDSQASLLRDWRGYPDAFHDSVGATYRELARLLLNKAQRASSRGQRDQILKRTRAVMEQYKSIELKEYFQDTCVTEQVEENAAVDIDDLIAPGTAVLYPIVFQDQLVLLLSTADNHIETYSIDVTESELAAQANRFRALMDPSRNPREMLKLAISLYDLLIKPVQKQLGQLAVSNLVVVPDGVLRTIPFAALYDGEQFLIERYAIAISPGLTLTDTAPSRDNERRVFAGGLSQSVQGYSGLPYVKDEVETISTHYAGRTFLDKNFTAGNILSELGRADYQWVTFSTHGYIDPNFEQSYLLAYDKKVSFDELESALQVGKINNREVDLLILSACDTAVGDQRAALGLAGLALKSGVKSTVASLWTVNDRYTALLIPQFLDQLSKPGTSKAQALQRAQQSLIRDHGATHPYYWAAFVVAGNWL